MAFVNRFTQRSWMNPQRTRGVRPPVSSGFFCKTVVQSLKAPSSSRERRGSTGAMMAMAWASSRRCVVMELSYYSENHSRRVYNPLLVKHNEHYEQALH